MTVKLGELPMVNVNKNAAASLAESVTQAIQNYFNELKGHEPLELYQLVMEEVEVPLLKGVMEYCKYNQSRAAVMLGLSRGTLRTKLRRYFDDKYAGNRE